MCVHDVSTESIPSQPAVGGDLDTTERYVGVVLAAAAAAAAAGTAGMPRLHLMRTRFEIGRAQAAVLTVCFVMRHR